MPIKHTAEGGGVRASIGPGLPSLQVGGQAAEIGIVIVVLLEVDSLCSTCCSSCVVGAVFGHQLRMTILRVFFYGAAIRSTWTNLRCDYLHEVAIK